MYIIPLAVLLIAILLAIFMVRWFEPVIEVLTPILLGVCVLAAVGGTLQRVSVGRRAQRRIPVYESVGRIVDQLIEGGVSLLEAKEVARSWQTMNAARSEVAHRTIAEQQAIRQGLLASGAWQPVAERATPSNRKWMRVRALHDLGWLGASDAAHLVHDSLADEDDDVAWAAIAALGGMEEDAAYEHLLDLLPARRFAPSRIAQVLETSRHPHPVPLLRARVEENAGPVILFWVVYLLGRSREGAALDPLLTASAHPDANVRASTAEALGRLGDDRAVERLLEMVEDESWFVRLHACRSLGDLRARSAKGALEAAADSDPIWWVRRRASDGLERLEEVAA